jgi:TonB family protein
MTPYASGGRITQEDGSGNATELQGRQIAATAPANGDALTWVSSTSKWTPVAIPTTPLASAPPLALASTATPGTSAFAAHGDHVHPTTGLAVLASANVFTDLQTLSVVDGGGGNPTAGGTLQRGGSGKASRSLEDVRLVFERNKGSIYAIYNRALREDPALQGKVVVELKIAPSGEVIDCRIVSTELKTPELERKLIARIQQFDFGAKQVEQMVVTYPLDFLPS